MLDLDHSSFSFIAYNDDVSDSIMCHARLGHIGKDRWARLAREGLLGSITNVSLPMCEPCLAGRPVGSLLVRLQRQLILWN